MSWNKVCIDCGDKCNGKRCKICFVKQYKPNKNQLMALASSGTQFKKGNQSGINNINTRFKKGRKTWNKGITGKASHTFGHKHTPEAINKIRARRATQVLPLVDTKPEQILQGMLRAKGIAFKTHVELRGRPDIFIEPNICIFVDGNYWHANPKMYCDNYLILSNTMKGFSTAREIQEKDTKVTNALKSKGYKVVRIWESTIYNGNQKLMY